MRLATITNWAYGATLCLTLFSSTTMLLASKAQEDERAAVERRYQMDHITSNADDDVMALNDMARDYVIKGDPAQLFVYQRDLAALGPVEQRVQHIRDSGAKPDEVTSLVEAMRLADTLHDEQQAAIALREKGDAGGARDILFSAEYERQLDRVRTDVERFQYRLDQRTDADVRSAIGIAKIWKGIAESVLAVTGLLFLCVLYFVFKRRVLRPVVRLSDVVNRLAAQDFAVEPPDYEHIDEIGDMTQAVRVFRENGIMRQKLEEDPSQPKRIVNELAVGYRLRT